MSDLKPLAMWRTEGGRDAVSAFTENEKLRSIISACLLQYADDVVNTPEGRVLLKGARDFVGLFMRLGDPPTTTKKPQFNLPETDYGKQTNGTKSAT